MADEGALTPEQFMALPEDSGALTTEQFMSEPEETKGAPSWGDWAKKQTLGVMTGVGKAVPLGQDIPAAIGATLSEFGGMKGSKNIPDEGSWMDRFHAAKRAQMAAAEKAGEEAPTAQTVGMGLGLAGTLPLIEATAPAEAALAARFAPRIGETAAQALSSGATGAGLGAAQGLGEGDTLQERLGNAVTGGLTGAGLGTALPLVAKGAGTAYRKGRELLEGAEKGAERKIREVTERDLARGYDRLTEEEIEAAKKRGQEILPIDIGGSELKGEARRAANISPEAEAQLTGTLRERYEGQQKRYESYLKDLAGNDLDAAGVAERMREEAQNINRPAYQKAYEAGSKGVWNPELYRLSNSPVIKKSFPEAIEKIQNRAIVEGRAPMENPFVKDKSGNYFLPEGYKPNLEFWDTVKRTLDDKISALERKGKYDKSRDIKAVRTQLLNNLDTAVPEFKQARSGAAKAFGEDNAFDAGLQFLSKQKAVGISEAKKAFSKMGDAEKDLFSNGVIQDLAQRIKNKGVSSDVSKMFDSPELREKLSLALGPERAAELEAFNRVEDLMARSHQAIQSNSTTAKQLSRMGVLGEAASKGVKKYVLPVLGAAAHGPVGMGLGAAAQATIEHLASTLNESQARFLAQKLLSKNPKDLRVAAQIIAENPKTMSKLRNITQSLSALSAREVTRKEPSIAASDREERASGGSVGKRDYPAKRLSRLERAAKRAQAEIALETKPIMQKPDALVAQALEMTRDN
jgi:hypothetical protein